MFNKFKTMALLLSMSLTGLAYANDLGTCMIDSLNGKERKDLGKWMFFAMAAHPSIHDYSNISAKDIDESDKHIGGLVTRLLVDDCKAELSIALKEDPIAIQKAFEIVGRVAMQELMANEVVVRAITNYSKYADLQKIRNISSGN